MAKDDKDTKAKDAGLPKPDAESVRRHQEGEKHARELEARYARGGAMGVASAELGKQLDPEKRKLLEQAEKIAQRGELDAKGISDVAGLIGAQAGLDEDKLKLIKALGGDDFDAEKAASVPGLIVDKETGKVSVLGLLELDPKDPTSKMIANLAGAGYNLVAQNLNEFALGKVYKAVAGAAAKSEGLQGYAHGAGMAAATSLVAGISFWPDFVKARQQEKNYQQSLGKLAQRFAPLLDDYAPAGRGTISQFFSVPAEANQMIANERWRAAAQQNAERFRNTVEILGRVPLFAASMGYGAKKMGDAASETEAKVEAAKSKKPSETAEQAKMRQLKEKADSFQKELGLERKDAVKMAQEELAKNPAKAEAEAESGFLGRFKRDVVGGGVLAAAPIATMIANNLYKKRLEDRGIQAISASDMVQHLGAQLDDNPKSDRFTLPKGMSELGSKSGNNQLKLEDYIEQVFRQHERDTHGNDAAIPARYGEQLHEACALIAKAIREDKMDGRLALIKLVGEQQIVRPGGRFVEDADTVKERIAKVEEALFLKESVDPKAQLQEMGISPETVREQWRSWSDEERAFAALTLGEKTVEYAGIPAQQVHHLCENFKQDYAQSLSHVVSNLAAMDKAELKKQGASSTDLKRIEDFASKAANINEPDAAMAQQMTRSEIAGVRHAVANIVLAPSAHLEGKIAVHEQLHRHS